jgi:hypothetical protein
MLNIIRIVFEKGIDLRRTEDDVWFFQSVRGKQLGAIPGEVVQKYGVRPILVSPSKGKQILDLEHSELIQIALAKDDVPMVFHSYNLSYILGAICHHCKRLADTYSEICRTFARFPFPKELGDHNRITFGEKAEPYYEFDALITAALRSYNTTRYIVWHAFRPAKDSVPTSFQKTLRLCKGLPKTLLDRLNLSWSRFGSRVKEYRDCIQHYNPIIHWSPYARMERLEGGV